MRKILITHREDPDAIVENSCWGSPCWGSPLYKEWCRREALRIRAKGSRAIVDPNPAGRICVAVIREA